jgi:hypothetical protein
MGTGCKKCSKNRQWELVVLAMGTGYKKGSRNRELVVGKAVRTGNWNWL